MWKDGINRARAKEVLREKTHGINFMSLTPCSSARNQPHEHLSKSKPCIYRVACRYFFPKLNFPIFWEATTFFCPSAGQARRQNFISGVAPKKSLGGGACTKQDNFSMSGTSACKKLKYTKVTIENCLKTSF